MSPNDCAELHKIADALVMIWALIAALAFVKFLWWVANIFETPYRASSSYGHPEVENEGGPDFTWRGHEAEDAYREKHWGSRRELRRMEEDRKIQEAVDSDRRSPRPLRP